MESNSCPEIRDTPGALSLPDPAGEPIPAGDPGDNSLRCQHIDALGRRCRMFAPPREVAPSDIPDLEAPVAEGLCLHHAKRLSQRRRDVDATAAELLSSITDFTDAASVNQFLGNLLRLVALKRVSRRDGMAMAYISRLILNSQTAQDRRELIRCQIAGADARQKQNLPARLIWDLPLRPKPPEQDQSPVSSEVSPPQPATAAPVGTGSAAEPSPQACAKPASGAPLPVSDAGPRAPIPGFTLTREGHTRDWYAPASWPKPKPASRGFVSQKEWHYRQFRRWR